MPIGDPKPFAPLLNSPHTHVTLNDGVVFTYNTPKGANSVGVQALDQNVRFTMDGTAPSADLGFRLVADNPAIRVDVTDGQVLKFFTEATGGILELQAAE